MIKFINRYIRKSSQRNKDLEKDFLIKIQKSLTNENT